MRGRRGADAVDLRMRGLRALVTGAAGGIGAAVARALAGEDVTVAGLDREPAEAVGIRVVVDLRDEAAVARGVADAVAALGGLDLLVCCAGVSGPVGTPLERTTLAEWEAVFAVNVTGAFLVLRAAVPHLRASSSPAVVLVASDSAFAAVGGMVPYAASKAAVLQLARAAAVEFELDGIRVNAVCPSIVDTPMSRGDLGRGDGFDGVGYPVQTADDVARGVAYLLSPVAGAVNATGLVSDFGYSARSSFPA